jgi:retron-type reverse transcriptase
MRNLGIPTVIDRVIQQAIAQVLTPIYEEQFSNSSYGFRPNRSCEMAIVKSLELINDGYDWVVDIDLERFFDTVHHDRLMNIIRRTIKDGEVISLIRKFLVSGVMVQGKYKDTTIGTPQGGNLSPLLSNIMLNELDKELDFFSNHDALTGLYNRRYSIDKLMKYDNEHFYPLGFIIMDINGLKLINDVYGYKKGDDLIKAIADMFRKKVSKKCIAGRDNGGESSILCTNVGLIELQEFKNRIKKEVSR